jgi:hypothetical protein
LEIDPTNKSENSKLYYNRSLVLSKMDKHEEALRDIDTALEFDPKYVKALTKKVRIQIDLEMFDEAVKNAEEASACYVRCFPFSGLCFCTVAVRALVCTSMFVFWLFCSAWGCCVLCCPTNVRVCGCLRGNVSFAGLDPVVCL